MSRSFLTLTPCLSILSTQSRSCCCEDLESRSGGAVDDSRDLVKVGKNTNYLAVVVANCQDGRPWPYKKVALLGHGTAMAMKTCVVLILVMACHAAPWDEGQIFVAVGNPEGRRVVRSAEPCVNPDLDCYRSLQTKCDDIGFCRFGLPARTPQEDSARGFYPRNTG